MTLQAYTIGDNIDQEWHWIQPYIDRAFARNVDGLTSADALEAIKGGQSLVLVIADGDDVLNVSMLDILPDALHFRTIAGKDMERWLGFLDQMSRMICKGLGLRFQTSISRRGMVKPMQRLGFKIHSYYLVREVG